MLAKCVNNNVTNNINIINIEELIIIMEWTDKAYFNKELYEISYFNEKKEGWLKVPVIYPEILFEKFLKTIDKEDFKELFEIIFLTSGYYELEAQYDVYDQLLRENDLLDYFYKFSDDLRKKLLISWCNENNINYKVEKISEIRSDQIIDKVDRMVKELDHIETIELEKKIFKNFCNEFCKEKKYNKILGKVNTYDSFEKIIAKHDEIDDEWTRYVMDYKNTNLLKKKWSKDMLS